MSRPNDWPTDSEVSSYATAARRGRLIGVVLLVLFAAGALAAVLVWWVSQPVKHPGGTPPLVADRVKLPSCGSYDAQPGPPGTPPPTTPQQVSVNRCIMTAYQKGRPAEAKVTAPPDDTQAVAVLYFRVLGPHRAQLIVEEVPRIGRIDARIVDCAGLTETQGQLSCP